VGGAKEYPNSARVISSPGGPAPGNLGFDDLLFISVGPDSNGNKVFENLFDSYIFGRLSVNGQTSLSIVNSTGREATFSPLFHSGFLDARRISLKDMEGDGGADIVLVGADGLPFQVAFGEVDSAAGGYYFEGFDAERSACALLATLLDGFLNALKTGGSPEISRYLLNQVDPGVRSILNAPENLRRTEANRWRVCQVTDFSVDKATAACERVNEDQSIGLIYIEFFFGPNGWRIYAVG
jgi:hypothetical protein